MFADRHDAGSQLARALAPFADEDPIILGVPRGGVPVAAEVALALEAPLDIVTVRKLGAPQNPEYAFGAVAEGGTVVVDPEIVRQIGITREQIREIGLRETRELHRRLERFDDARLHLDARGRTVVIVDDGLATGLSDLAAIRAVRARGAQRIIVAAPVGSDHAVELLGAEADEVVCLSIPDPLHGVGAWYQDFSPVPDDQVLHEMRRATARIPVDPGVSRPVEIATGPARLTGDLVVPPQARGLVLFAHGSGSSRLSPRNQRVAEALNGAGLATLLFDLLTPAEARRRELVFDIPVLASRLVDAVRWAIDEPMTRRLPIGLFGASTGAAAALAAAAELGPGVAAVVSRGGRPDLAGELLPRVAAPTLLIVGGDDREVLELNRWAAARLGGTAELSIVPGAGHLFEEPGALDEVARLAGRWLARHLPRPAAAPSPAA